MDSYCLLLFIIIIVINEYPEAGLMARFPSNVPIINTNFNKKTLLILLLHCDFWFYMSDL